METLPSTTPPTTTNFHDKRGGRGQRPPAAQMELKSTFKKESVLCDIAHPVRAIMTLAVRLRAGCRLAMGRSRLARMRRH
ncbi:MAG: hypothetical protein ACREDY_21615 [Bradyrhizobium sp.]